MRESQCEIGDACSVEATQQLLGLSGKLQGRKYQFLLDSGASCNYVSQALLTKLGLDWDLVIAQDVRLADNTVLKTAGKIRLSIQLGPYTYVGSFIVLNAHVPLILGMPFFTSVAPKIDWQTRAVSTCVNGHVLVLPVVSFDRKAASSVQVTQETWPSVTTRVTNSFAGLSVDDSHVVSNETSQKLGESVCASGQLLSSISTGQQVAAPTVVEKRVCASCGCHISRGRRSDTCHKCQNHSFVNLKNQLIDVDGDLDSDLVVPVIGEKSANNKHIDSSDDSDDDAKNSKTCEVVNYTRFVRGGKLNQYQIFGVITPDAPNTTPASEIVDDQQSDESCLGMQLMFTHRAAHGGNDDGDVAHGQYDQIAREQLDQLKTQFPRVFSEPVYPVDRSDCPIQFEHKIPLIDESAAPPKRRLYPLDALELAELKKQIEEFLSSNRIEPSDGAYGAPILFAKKKDGRLRMCIDYRMLNTQTKADVFPLPRIDELLQRLDGAQIFSKLDLRDGYHQIPMADEDKPKTAFTCRYGTFQFTVMPFGLMTAPSTFQRMMNRVFFELLDEGVLCYLDDLLIYSKTIE